MLVIKEVRFKPEAVATFALHCVRIMRVVRTFAAALCPPLGFVEIPPPFQPELPDVLGSGGDEPERPALGCRATNPLVHVVGGVL